MAADYSQIEFIERVRNAEPRVQYLEIVVNGRELGNLEAVNRYDLVTRFTQGDLDDARSALSALASERAGPVGETVLLYTCPLCGDFGCGAIQVLVTRDEHEFEWKDFAYVNCVDDPQYLPIGPFRFRCEDYLRAMNGVLGRLDGGKNRFGEQS